MFPVKIYTLSCIVQESVYDEKKNRDVDEMKNRSGWISLWSSLPSDSGAID